MFNGFPMMSHTGAARAAVENLTRYPGLAEIFLSKFRCLGISHYYITLWSCRSQQLAIQALAHFYLRIWSVFCPTPGQFILITGTTLTCSTDDSKSQCHTHSIVVRWKRHLNRFLMQAKGFEFLTFRPVSSGSVNSLIIGSAVTFGSRLGPIW